MPITITFNVQAYQRARALDVPAMHALAYARVAKEVEQRHRKH